MGVICACTAQCTLNINGYIWQMRLRQQCEIVTNEPKSCEQKSVNAPTDNSASGPLELFSLDILGSLSKTLKDNQVLLLKMDRYTK